MKRVFHIILIATLLSGSVAFGQSMGKRVIGMNVNQSQNNNYDSAIYYAQNACVKVVNMLVTWNSIETSPGVYNDNLFTIANGYYPAKNLQLSVNLAPINTNVLAVPADLKNISFSDTLIIHRFERFVDNMFASMPKVSLYCLNIGNESDIYFNGDSTATYVYKVFYDSVRNYIKKTHPALPIGTTITWSGLTSSFAKVQHKLNQNSDIISTTYYGINSNYTVKTPSQIPTDIAALITQYPDSNQPVCFQECGYPTSDTCLSNDSLQNVFMFNVFQTWDFYKNNIPLISFLNETDWSTAEVDTLANYYNYHNPVWMEYLRTLGLRTYPGNGISKPAYNMLVYEAALHNACTPSSTPLYNDIANKIKAFPNPASGYFTIEGLDVGINSIEVFNCLGQVVLAKVCKGPFSTMNITKLPKGFFIVQVRNMDNNVIGRQGIIFY